MAFLNASDRPLDDVTVQLAPEHFVGLDESRCRVKVWKDNHELPGGTDVISGKAIVSLSPKGIIALRIDGLEPIVTFQHKVRKTSTDVKKPDVRKSKEIGDVETAFLSFGPNLQWLVRQNCQAHR